MRRARLLLPAYAALGALLVAACGNSEAATMTTVTIPPRSYAQKPPATTTTTIDLADAEPGDIVQQEQEYVVQPNDGISAIAARYGISGEELAAHNRFANGIREEIYPGQVLKIPPGAIYVVADGGGSGDDGSDDDATEPESTDGAVDDDGGDDEPTGRGAGADADGADADGADADDGADDACVAGTYRLEPNDYPAGVAAQFDVTLEALNAANAGTPGYSAFLVGTEIVIPASSDC